MIDVKELSIGNYLELEGRCLPVLAIDNQREFTHSKTKEFFKCAITVGEYNDDGLMWTTSGRWLKDFNPIPLTEQWLIDFGFILGNPNTNYWQLNFDECDRVGFMMGGHLKVGIHLIDETDTEIGKTCLYVHQLQNLYFALTGKELIKKQ